MDNMNRVKEICLKDKTYTVDEIGQSIEASTDRIVYGYMYSASLSEFYNAGLRGFKPDKVFDVWSYEYNGQEELECDGVIYSVYRTYERDDGRTELHVEKKAGDAL